MNIDVYNTHIEVYPYTKSDCPLLEDMFTATDKFADKTYPCGYMIENNKLYLPAAMNIAKLENLLNVKATYKHFSDPYDEMNTEHSSFVEARDDIQERAVNFLNKDNNQLALNLQTGFGKEQPYSSKIPTPKGYRRMGDLKINDVIFGAHGKPVKITNIYEQGIKHIYIITFSNGSTARCGYEHLWLVRENENSEYKVMEFKDIYENYKNIKYQIPRVSHAVEYDTRCNNLSYIRRAGIYYAIKATDPNARIPDELMYNNKRGRIEFLKGYLYENGTITEDNGNYIVSCTCNNPTISKQIVEMLRSLGWDGEIYEKNQQFLPYKSIIVFDMPNKDKHKLFIDLDKKEIAKEAISNENAIETFKDYLTIVKIQHCGKEECRCLTVNNPKHLYLTDDFIVTHNTVCVSMALTNQNVKSLIIVPTDVIKNQWLNTLTTMFDYKPKHIINIAGSNIINQIMDDSIDISNADIFIVNHSTLHSYIMQVGGYQFHEFIKKLRIGVKVYDESHLNFANILLIDFFSNTKKTFYITATFDRSDKTESMCFKRCFQKLETFGENESIQAQRKHVLYHVVNINSNIPLKSKAKLLSYPGFAQPINTLIPLASGGCKRLGELAIGDLILDRLGRPTKIIAMYEHPSEDAYEIKFSDGRTSICSAEHLWYVKRSSWKFPYRMEAIMLKDIIKDYRIERNRVNIKSGKYIYNYKIPVNKSIQYSHKNIPIDPYILGAFIGDGCCGDKYLNLSNLEKSPKEGIVRYIENITGFTALYRYNGKCHFLDQTNHHVKTKDFFTGCTDFMIDCKAQFKSIPNDYIYNDEETRWSILQGLMDTDGRIKILQKENVCYKSIEYTSTSEQLLKDIQQICWSLGLGCGYYQDTRSYKYSLGYAGVLSIQIDNKLVPKLFRCNSKKVYLANIVSNYKDFKDRSMTTILNIKKLNKKIDMRCITVDNDEQLYLTNDYIVTHNTTNKYAKYAYFEDVNQTAYNTILDIVKKFDEIDGKILIFVPTIESVEEVCSKLRKDVSYKSVGLYHSKVDREEKEACKKKDIIVSTERSLGTGTDIKDLRCVILGTPIASKVLAQQLIGRLREYAPDKDTYFFDVIDVSIPPVNWYFRARFSRIKLLVKEVIYLNM